MTDGSLAARLRRREQLLENLDRLVAQGRVSASEAAEVRSADDLSQFEEVLHGIRRRHVRGAVASAVARGSIAQADAEEIGARLDDGADPHAASDVRRRLRRSRAQDGPPSGSSATLDDASS